MADMSSMTTSGAWLAMYTAFLEDLSGQFPEDATVVAAGIEAEAASDDDAKAKAILDDFLSIVGPRQPMVAAKDASFAKGLKFHGIDFEALWKSELMAEQSKGAIFQYLSSLLMIAQTLSMIPPELMSGIEAMAKQIAGNMTAAGVGEGGGMPDIGSMMSMMQNMGGLGGLANLAGLAGLGGPPAQPARQIEDVTHQTRKSSSSRTNKHKNRR